MFLSEEERNFGENNSPIVLCVQKMPQGQVLSPHIISLRGSAGARKLTNVGVQKRISERLTQAPLQTPKTEENLFVAPEEKEDEVLSSIEQLFRGKNARVQFENTSVPNNADQTPYTIPSQQEQFQKIRSSQKGIMSSWFSGF